MPAIQTNPDLPLSWRRPGTFISINLNNPGSAPGVRLLLLGERTSAAQRAANALYRANSEQDVIDGSGANSILRPMFAAALAQVGAGKCEAWIGHVDEANAGVAAVYEHKITASPTGAGMVSWLFCGRLASVAFTAADTATTIAAALAAAASGTAGGGAVISAGAFGSLPIATISASAGLITMTMKAKAAWGEDMPSQWYVTPGKGVQVGPGAFVYTDPSVGAGSATITCGRKVYSFTLDVAGVAAAAIVTGLVAAVTGDGPLTASDGGGGTLNLFYQNDYPVRHVTAKIVTSTGTTINVNARGVVAAGTDAPNGVVGSGSPTLTTLLAAIEAQGTAFKAWASPWSDATTLGTLDTTIEAEGGGGGGQQRGQVLVASSCAALATAGAIPGATSPALTASVRGTIAWPALESANAGWQYTARIAAARTVNDRPNRNFNGLMLKSSTSDPLIGPSSAAAVSPASDINSAINSYCLAPVVWSEALGRFVVEHARTTSNSSDRRLHKWSLIAQLDAQRDYIRQKVQAAMTTADGTGVSLMTSGTPFSEGIVTLSDFEDVVYQCCVEMERLGFYDGADALKDGIHAQQNQSDPGRIDIIYTASALVDVDQASIVANRGSVAQ